MILPISGMTPSDLPSRLRVFAVLHQFDAKGEAEYFGYKRYHQILSRSGLTSSLV